MNQKRYAYLIGANGPQTEHLKALKYAQKDAQRLADALLAPHCGFTKAEWTLAENPQPTLAGLNRFMKQCEPSDLLLVHFSGHGNYEGQLFLVCNSTDIDDCISSAININDIKFYLDKCKARHKVLVLDCCHAGAAHTGAFKGDQGIQSALQQTLEGSVNVILSACSRRDRTRELETLDGGAGFLSWTLATACTSRFQEVSRGSHSLSLMDIWQWVPTALQEVNSSLGLGEQLPQPLLLSEMKAGDDSEIWLTEQRRAHTSKFVHDDELIRKKYLESVYKRYSYDVALSYASEDRAYADSLAANLQHQGVKVFYDRYEKATLWGQDLYAYLSDLYQNKAHYCVLFLSRHYAAKLWTKHELRSAQARAFTEKGVYMLPIRLDETEIPGILPTTAYLDWRQETVESISRAVLEKLEDYSPKSRQQWFDESSAYWKAGYYEKALIASQRGMNIDPYDWYGYYNIAWKLLELERYQETLAICEEGIQRDPTNCEDILYQVKGDALLGLERYEEALIIFEELLQRPPYNIREHAQLLCSKGNIFFGLEQYEKAFAMYDQAIQLDPKYAYSYQSKGHCLWQLDRNEEALAIFELAIHLAPKDAYNYHSKGDALYDLKLYEEALTAYERAILLSPKDEYTYRRKGDTLKLLNRYEEAQQAYEMARQCGYSK